MAGPCLPVSALAQPALLASTIDAGVKEVEPKVVAWRRDIHEHPELGNRETRTAGIVAEHLRALGFEVRTGVARTGVVGILLRAVGRARSSRFAPTWTPCPSPKRSTSRSRRRSGPSRTASEVGVMHACGHDNHVAILMGTAEVLAGVKDRLPGTVKFMFQPAEEGAPEGEKGGAELMVEEGVLENPKVGRGLRAARRSPARGTDRLPAGGIDGQ